MERLLDRSLEVPDDRQSRLRYPLKPRIMNGASDLALIRREVCAEHLDDHKKDLALMGEYEVVVVHVRHGDRPPRLRTRRNMFPFQIQAKGNVR